MKKLLIIPFIIIFVAVVSLFAFLEYKLPKEKQEKVKLNKEITEITNNTQEIKKEISTYEEKITTLKSEKEITIKEEEVWKETKEKLEKALS